MNPYLAPTLAYAAAAAAALSLAMPPKDARAEDITVVKTPFVSSASRADVRSDYIQHRMPLASTEWGSQMNEQSPYKSSITKGDARAGYVQSRQDVNQFSSEDSGSYLLSHQRRDPATVMGAPSR